MKKPTAKKPATVVAGLHTVEDFKKLVLEKVRKTDDHNTLIRLAAILLPEHDVRQVSEVTGIRVTAKVGKSNECYGKKW